MFSPTRRPYFERPRFFSFLFQPLTALCLASTAWAQGAPAPAAAPDSVTESAATPEVEPPPAAADPAPREASSAPEENAPREVAASPDGEELASAEPSAPSEPEHTPVAPTKEAEWTPVPTTGVAEAAEKGQAGGWFLDHFFDHIKVRGYTQFRFNQPTTNERLVNVQGDKSMGGDGGFFVRRARIVLHGDVHPLVSIYLQPDFASATESGLHFAQMRDWYFDLSAPGKEFRLRVGQSKIPFGFENMQSSSNRVPLDRSDAINSAFANERDLGAFFYWAPTEIRKRFKHLVEDGLKGSGDYGVFALGVFNGQTANKPELNANKHVVSRLTYPFAFGDQIVEVGGAGYVGRYVVSKEEGITGDDEFWDARGELSFTLYPQPFGLQVEYNMGIGPELTNIQEQTSPDGSVFTGVVREGFLHGGYALLTLKLDELVPGTIIPYVRGQLYEGGKKHEVNAPRYSVRELEVGVEWQPIPALEFTGAFATADRTYSKLPYEQESGQLARFQLQINY